MHPPNPFPRPSDWMELNRRIFRENDVLPLIEYPYFRRHWPTLSGMEGVVPVSLLAALPAYVPPPPDFSQPDPDRAAREEERQIQSLRGQAKARVRVAIEDGATTVTGATADRLTLEARRRDAAPVLIALFWPVTRTTMEESRWWLVMNYGSTEAIERAFVTGKLEWNL